MAQLKNLRVYTVLRNQKLERSGPHFKPDNKAYKANTMPTRHLICRRTFILPPERPLNPSLQRLVKVRIETYQRTSKLIDLISREWESEDFLHTNTEIHTKKIPWWFRKNFTRTVRWEDEAIHAYLRQEVYKVMGNSYQQSTSNSANNQRTPNIWTIVVLRPCRLICNKTSSTITKNDNQWS